MRTRTVGRFVTVIIAIASSLVTLPAAQPPAADCGQWQQCRDLALDARAKGQYERFHDLAWRAIQTGPPNDPALMYLLARAQSLSGRRRDALIMLRRLADMGVATDAATEEDLRRTRELPGWRELELAFTRLGSPLPAEADAGSPDARTAALPPERSPTPRAAAAAAATPASAAAVAPRPITDVARFSTDAFVPAGLAYDAVSQRFLFADGRGRRLVVVGEGSTRTADLVRGETAGFHDITGLAIDARRGDLWVTSTDRNGDEAAIHKLQLISGRVIAMFDPPASSGMVRLVDVAIATDGTVLVLDAAVPRVLGLRWGATAVQVLTTLDVAGAVSITAGGNERIAYVAHRDGIVRLDVQSQTAAPVGAPAGISLGQFERLRWHRNSLVGVQTFTDGSRGIVRLQLNGSGQAVTARSVIDASPDLGTAPAFATLSGDDFYYGIVTDGAAAARAGVEILVRRLRLP